jgi:hypothetical protein
MHLAVPNTVNVGARQSDHVGNALIVLAVRGHPLGKIHFKSLLIQNM